MKSHPLSRHPFVLAGCISSALSLLAANAFSANLIWDANAATLPNPVDGANTWDVVTARFWNGTTNVLWTNNPTDVAVFGTGTAIFNGVAGAVTVSGALTAGGLDFEPYVGNVTKYNITGGTSLTLAGATPTIAVNTNATRPFAAINTILAGTAGIDVTSTTGGILEFGAQANTFTGGLRLQSGSSLSIGGDLGLGAAANGLTFAGTSTLIARASFTEAATHAVSIANGSTAKFDVLTGATLTVSSAIGQSGGAGSLQKDGLGGLTLNATETYTGETRLRQGTLTLNFANTTAPVAPNADLINSASLLRIYGGTLAIVGKASTANTQAFSGLVLDPGASTLTAAAGAAGTTAVNLGPITRNAGSSLNVTTIAAGTSYATSSPLANGILGGYATIGNADWVTLSAGNFVAYAAYQNGTDATAWIPADNVSLAGNPTVGLAGDATINSLRLTAASNLAIPAANTLTLSSGGLLVTGAGTETISGGTLRGAAGADLLVHQNSTATTTISAAIGNNGVSGLTKTGTGTLVLSGANAYAGNTFLNAGTLDVNSDAALGAGATLTSRAGTTLRISGGSAFSSAKNFLFDLGSNSFGGAALAGGPNAVGNFNVDVTNPAGATISGAFDVTAGTMVKTGAGTLTLTNPGTNRLARLNGGLGFTIENGGLVFNGGPTSQWQIGQAEFTIGDNTASAATATVSSGTLNVGSFTSIGRGNGTTGLASGLTVTGGSTFNAGNLYTGFANGVAGYNTNPFITLSGSSITNVTDTFRLSESAGSTTTAILSGTAQLLINNNAEIGTAGRALLKIGAGTTVNANQVLVGNAANGSGAVWNRGSLTVRGGAAVTNFPLGNAAGAYGYYLHDTATNASANELGVGGSGGGNGVLEVRSGQFAANNWLTVNRGANATSSLVLISGGTLAAPNNGQFRVNSDSVNAGGMFGQVDVGGATARIVGGNASTVNLNQQGTALNQGILSVHDGGSVQTTQIFAGNALGYAGVNLNGGTLLPSANGTLLGANLDAVTIFPNGAIFDTAGFNTTTGTNALIAPAGNGLPAAIPVATAGAGYLGRPVVRISDTTGTGATAVANFDETTGQVTGITVTSPGSNYTAPTITLVGGGFTTAATLGAVALAPNATTGGLTKTGAGTLTVSSTANSYGGPTRISNGTLSIPTISFGGTNSTLGASSSAAANLILDGGTLQYTGGSTSTDRDFTISAGKTGTVEVATATATLTLSGNSAATNGNLTKTGNGTLTLAGTAYQHTGTTTASAGVLAASGSFQSGFAVNGTGHLTAQNLGVGTLVAPTLALSASGSVDFEFGSGNDTFVIANPGGLSLGSTSVYLYNEFGTSPFTSNGTYTLFDYNASFAGALGSAFTIANSQVGKIYSIADVPGVSSATGLTTTIELTINDAIVTEWTNGASDNLWTTAGNWTAGIPNNIGAVATFGTLGAGGTVLVNGPKTTGSIVFNNPTSYTLSGSGAITLNNGLGAPSISAISGSHTVAAPLFLAANTNITPAAGTTITLSGNISGNAALAVTDAGTVVLSGTNSYTGPTTIFAGTLEIGGGASVGGSSALVERSGAVLRVNSGGITTITQPLTFELGAATAVGASGAVNGTANFVVEASSGAFATFSGLVTNPSGSLLLRGGGAITLTNPGANTLSTIGNLGTVVEDGSLTLNGGATATYGVVNGELTIGANTPAQASLTLASGTLNVGTFTSVGRGNGTIGLQSSLNVTGGTLNTLNLFTGYANGVFGYNAAPVINVSGSGIVNVTNTVANSAVRLGENQGSNAQLNLSNNATLFSNGDFQIGFGGNGLVTVADNATLTVARMGVGFGTNGATLNTGAGAVRQTGGLVQVGGVLGGDWRIGGYTGTNDAQVYGSYAISNGILTTNRNLQIGAYGRGVLDINGAGASVVTTGSFPVIGRFAGGFGLLNISAGTFNQSTTGNLLIIGEGGTGVVNVSGTGSLIVAGAAGAAGNLNGTGGIRLGHTATGSGQLNLNGGTVTTTGIAESTADSTGRSSLYLNGGTIKAGASNTTFLQGLDSAIVGPGGVTFDTNGNSITVSQGLSKPTGSGVSIPNAGLAILDGGAGYLGQPFVQIVGDGTGATAVANVNAAGVVTGITITNPGTGYTNVTEVNLLGGGSSTPATVSLAGVTTALNATTGGVTKTGSGTLTLNGTQNYASLTTIAGRTNLDASLANASIYNLGGILNVDADATNSAVTVGATTVFTVSQTLASLVIDNGGTATLGAPAAAPEFAPAAIAPVPEPGSTALIFGGLVTLFGLRRRS